MEGLLPLIRETLAQFEEYIKWEDNIPRPQKGLVESYDMLQDEAAGIKVKLEDYLEYIRSVTGVSMLRYVHTKERYEIEFP
jgi:hypothetical protein